MSRAASQAARNSPTITNPAVLMLNRDIKPQKPVVRLSPWISCGSRLRASDRADDEADRHGQPGDGQVVVDLADRVEERPAVGQVHEQPVGGVHERHARGEQDRQADDRVPGDVLGGGQPRGRGQQGDLGGGVEAQAEHDPDRVQLPLLVMTFIQRPKNR